MFSCLLLLALSVSAAAASGACTFCALNAQNQAVSFDLSGLGTATYEAPSPPGELYTITTPCGQATSPSCGSQDDPFLQSCQGVGNLANISIGLTGSQGFVLTLHGGFDNPPMPNGRNAVYHFVCDTTVPSNNPPEYTNVTESPPGFYNVVWRTPAACGVVGGSTCAPPPPVPPPVPPPAPCTSGSTTCLPTWKPNWNMETSSALYTCNDSGLVNATYANLFGVTVLDWSNGKALWANAHPMTSEELITAQAELMYAQNPGVPGYAPRVWAYRNTIKALNWYTSVREKLDDPAYSSWFVKFDGFSDSPYPGGLGLAQNGSYHVPTCDWYNNGTAPRCSGFYHDQEQSPEHPGGGPAYPVDGACLTQCDCGPINPCGEYIFNHSGDVVNGQSFRDWFVNSYMISNETLFHVNPVTGEPNPIGLGWLDDSMTPNGPTEEDKNYIADTGADAASMATQVAAYRESMQQLISTVIPLGGFFWQLMDGGGAQLNTGINNTTNTAQCISYLRSVCVANSSKWDRFQFFSIPSGGRGATSQCYNDYTAEFLLTRGPYALLGYTWGGCTNNEDTWPFPAEWGVDYGEPTDPYCQESPSGSGVFTRAWTSATVSWDCTATHGTITPK